MFANCSSIIELPDISNLNFSNVTDMSYFFFGCESLKQLSNILKWDTKQLSNIEAMFENCKSLTFFPDISNWNKNKNISNKNHLFLNCQSLESLPDLSYLFSEEELKNNYIFEGCKKLEEKIKGNNKEMENQDLKHSDYKCDRLCICFEKVNYCCYYSFFIIVYTYLAIVIGYLSNIHLYNSFHLDNSNLYLNNPITNLINYTNISHIAEVNDITNLTKIKEISENIEEFINKEMNFTFINGNITFESSQRYLKGNSIIITIIFFLNIFIAIFAYNVGIQILYLTFIIITDIFTVIIEINYIRIIKHFYNSFYIFNNKLEKLFKKKLEQCILEDFKSLSLSFASIVINILISSVFVIIFILLFYDEIEKKIIKMTHLKEIKI